MGHSCTKEQITFKEGLKYNDIKDQIKPLDLMVFKGSDVVAHSIAYMENAFLHDGDWNHVGVVVTTDIMPIKNGIDGKLYIFESTLSSAMYTNNINDIERGTGVFGVQIRPLEEIIYAYDDDLDTKVGWCSLINNPIDKDIENVRMLMTAFKEEHGDATYDYNICNLLSTVMCTCTSCRRACCGRSNKFFCSELVATIYQLFGIIGPDVEPVKICPIELLGVTNDNIGIIVKLPPVVVTRDWKSVSEQS